jgi:hypothetical protein
MHMADAGSGTAIDKANLSFSDAAANFLPGSGAILTGLYKPTNFSPDKVLPLPAPLGPYGTNLAAFNGTAPNGTWSLYVVDDALMDTGLIAGGWSLTLNWQPVALAFQLSAPMLTGGSGSQMSLQGPAGKTYTIEASTDLVSWTPVATNTLSGTNWTFVVPTSTNYTKRFYRACCHP